ncbi:MAG: DUF4097 family beta strand repeat-containing protein [Candidatus Acidiferrales bacterium]
MKAIIQAMKLRRAAGEVRPGLNPVTVIWIILVLSGLLGIGLPGFASDQLFEKTFRLQPGGSFLLENVNGSVRVDGWNRDEVEVRAVKIAKQDPIDLSAVKIEVENAPGQLRVHTLYPKDRGADVAVEYHVYVPSRILLSNIVTVNGSVVVHGVEGEGDLRSVNGDVEVLRSSGRFSAKTTNGNVRLELSELRDGAPMNVETVNGSVVLALPSKAHANLRVLNFNGEFSSELPVTSTTASTTARAFRARLGAGGAEISVRTVNGAIHLVREHAV